MRHPPQLPPRLRGVRHGSGSHHGRCPPDCAGCDAASNSTFTAHTLYSGIFDAGSNAAFVRKLAAESWSLTNGTKIAPGRTSEDTRASPVSSPRRDEIGRAHV